MKNKIALISIILSIISVVIGFRGTVFLESPSPETIFTDTLIENIDLYTFIFIYYAFPIIGFVLSFYGKKSFLKYVAIYGSFSVMLWHVIIPAIMMTLWTINPIP
ncbi:hypothetical protein ACT6P6_22885 [Priestia endophytica]